jgi:hypothetical protein
MSQMIPGLVLSRIPNADLSAKRYLAMKLVAGDKVDVADGTSDYVIGWLQNIPSYNGGPGGRFADVAVGPGGTCKAMVSAAVVEGVLLKVDNAGKCLTGGGGGDKNFAIALEAASATGDIIEILPLACKLVT